MISYKINDSTLNKRKAKRVLRKLMKTISKLPKNLFNYIFTKNLIFEIGNIYSLTKVRASGYIDIYENKNIQFMIMIDENNKNIKETLYHELGHLIDMDFGCKANNKEITKYNLRNYSLSRTNKSLQEKMENEHFLFKNRPIEYCVYTKKLFDYEEIFADSFVEMITHKKYYNCLETKGLIYILTKEGLGL